LHAKVHALPTQVAVALATPVEHAVVQAPQWLTLLVVSTQVPLHSDMAPQPETHEEFEQTGVPPLQAVVQLPQWLSLLVRSTQAAPQALKPLLHAKVHALLTHAGDALATAVEQVWPHVLQLSGSVAGFEHPLLQSVEAGAVHPLAHAYVLPDATHAGVLPLHTLPQVPQLAAVVSWTQAPLHSVYPASHAMVHALLTHTACALATVVVQAWPHVWQLFASLVESTQLPLQFVGAAGGQPETHEYVPPDPAHTPVLPLHALPQVPQLAEVVNWTQAPPQRLYPPLHAKEHIPSRHVG
jgi:hypothetical protein